MKKPVHKIVLTIGVVIMLIAGCGGQDTSKSEIRKSRLIAVENKQLKKQSEQLRKELENQKELLAKCLQEKKDSEEQLLESSDQTIERLGAQVTQPEEETQKIINDLMESTVKDLEEIAKLREENENLKTEITELKKELEIHKGPAPPPHTD